MERAAVINTPGTTPPGTVPDVRGLGVREAVVRFEEAGFNVAFDGIGYVTAQTPPPGTKTLSGARVRLQLQQF